MGTVIPPTAKHCVAAAFLIAVIAGVTVGSAAQPAASPSRDGALSLTVTRDPADDSGLFVRGKKAATLAKGPQAQFDPAALASPYIRGGIIRLAWSSLEPSEGSYDWGTLDAIVEQLKPRGLKYILVVSAGSNSPKWLLESPRVKSFNFERKKRGAVISPLPWDEAYLDFWARFLRALGKHIGADPSLVAVRVAGVQAGTSVEMALPKSILQHGYTPERIKRAWAATLQVYAEAFPGKPFVITVNKLRDAQGESGEATTRAVVDQAVSRYGRRVVLSNSGIGPNSGEKGFSAQLIRSYTASDRALAQLGPWAPITGNSNKMARGKGDSVEKRFRDTFDIALRLRARYFGIDQQDLLDPRLQEGLSYVGAKQEAEEGRPLRFTVTASEGLTGLRYTARNLPAGATFDPATRTLTWTPGPGQAGVYAGLRFEVSDGSRTASQEIPIIVRRKAG
jgi:hypothetical protein